MTPTQNDNDPFPEDDAEARAALLTSILETIPESVMVIDMEGRELFISPMERQRRELKEWRPAIRVFTLAGEEVPTEDWTFARALRGDFVRNLEQRIQGMNGAAETRLMISTAPLFNSLGERTGAVITARDITALRETEERLRQSQKLETIGQLTGGMAHDFNNLLAAVLSSAEVLGRDCASDPKLKRAIDTITQAAERGAQLTRQLLAFSRKQELRPKRSDIGELVQSAAPLIRAAVGAIIELKTEIPEAPLYAELDATQLTNALLNLCVNARDAMPQGGELIIAVEALGAPPADFELDWNGPCARISVCDTGAGMSAEVLNRAIEPFFTTKEEGKGTGLGLSQVYGFVRQSGGDLRISSELGEGARVDIVLPQTPAPDASDKPSFETEEPASASLRVLVVDDDPLVRDALRLQLSDLGHDVAVASSAIEALSSIQTQRRYQLIISDANMPGPLNGGALLAALRAAAPKARLMQCTGGELKNADASDILVLQKPFNGAALARAIRDVMA